MHMHTHHEKPLVEKLTDQWKVFAGVIAVVLVAVAAVGIAGELKAKREREANSALYEAQVAARKAAGEKKFEEAEKALSAVAEKHKGTRAAFEAELMSGDQWMDAGNYDKAVAHYQAAAQQAGDSFSKLLAAYTVGIAKESAGKLDEAVKAYEDALNVQGSDFLRPEILMAQARCYEALKNPKKAIEIYKNVQEKYASRSYYSGAASAFEKQLSAKNL